MVNRQWRPVPALVLLVLAGSLIADRSDGCSCVQVSDDPVRQIRFTYGLADVLFDGRLVAIRDALGDLVPSGVCLHYPRCSYILAEFEVRDVWRDFSSERFVVMVRTDTDCSVRVEVGVWYFVAARFAPPNAPFPETGQCLGDVLARKGIRACSGREDEERSDESLPARGRRRIRDVPRRADCDVPARRGRVTASHCGSHQRRRTSRTWVLRPKARVNSER